MIKRWVTTNFEDEVEDLINLEAANFHEIVIRHTILLTMAFVAMLYLSVWFPVIWLVLYSASSYAVVFFSNRLTKTRDIRDYTSVLIVTLASVLIFRVMILYLWFFPHEAARYISFTMILASMRFSVNLMGHFKYRILLHATGDLIVLTILALSFLCFDTPFEGTNWVVLSIACIIIYYIATLRQNLAYIKELKLIEERTRQSQKMEAVGRLTGGVAHDFNNILTVVMGNLELYEIADTQAERRELITQTREAARRAADLTSQLLAFSRQSKLKQDIYKVDDIFTQVKVLTTRLLPANITLGVDVAPGTPAIRVDKTQLEVALVNLIINARDAMPDGGTLEMLACELPRDMPQHPSADGDAHVCIQLTDQGGGIPSEILDKVTEPFFTTKPVGKGSGLGLSMVKGFAEQSGGFLNITTVPNVSTNVEICLPAANTGPAVFLP